MNEKAGSLAHTLSIWWCPGSSTCLSIDQWVQGALLHVIDRLLNIWKRIFKIDFHQLKLLIACNIKQEGTLFSAFCAEASRRPWTSLNENLHMCIFNTEGCQETIITALPILQIPFSSSSTYLFYDSSLNLSNSITFRPIRVWGLLV